VSKFLVISVATALIAGTVFGIGIGKATAPKAPAPDYIVGVTNINGQTLLGAVPGFKDLADCQTVGHGFLDEATAAGATIFCGSLTLTPIK
jgi:hypothetical protein